LLLALTFVAARFVPPAGAAEFQPGKTYFGRSNYVEYLAGDLPFILSAPHGGRLKPEELPDREKGTFAFDINTQELARAIAAEFQRRTGRHPHVVICRVSRRKVDCNREIKEAAAGHSGAEQVWNEFQRFLDAARQSVVARHGRGLYIDLHGHGHKEQRLELGYLHKRETLLKPDAELNAPEIMAESSLRALGATVKIPYSELLRGPKSFGALLEARGFPCVPSPQTPAPGPEEPYFNGGYNTVRHARNAAPMAGLQIESNSRGVRDTEENRKKFAAALFEATREYLAAHFGLHLPAKTTAPATAQ
jgi:N-formylglutamate amidohydrolase